jgi:hypothetical protein
MVWDRGDLLARFDGASKRPQSLADKLRALQTSMFLPTRWNVRKLAAFGLAVNTLRK